MKRQGQILLYFVFILCNNAFAQKVEKLKANSKEHFRGLSVVSNEIVWVSGTKGAVGKSLDGGQTWAFSQVPGFEKTDFRDIEAFDGNTAIVIAIDSPAFVLRTKDGGATWQKVFEDHSKGVFLDAMSFYDKKNGVIVGDPTDGRAFILRTKNGGKKWKLLPANERPTLSAGEAFFAASGTNVAYFSKKEFAIVSGGLKARLFVNGYEMTLPMLQGKQMTGPNSIAVFENNFAIAGGNYEDRADTTGNFASSNFANFSWSHTSTPPGGYMSCVAYLSAETLITCGLPGVDYSTDGGKTFTRISDQRLHVVAKAKNGNAVFFAGPEGAIAKFVEQ